MMAFVNYSKGYSCYVASREFFTMCLTIDISFKIFHSSNFIVKVSAERTKRSHISHVPLWRNPFLLTNVMSSSVMNRTLNLPTVSLHPP